jgi:flagellar hook-associated protein FlgK
MQTTNPYKYLEQVSELFDTLNTREEINQVIDELEFLFDLIDPEFQDQVSDLINRLTKRLQELN